nr:hypothetical protein Iba_chr06cCG6780 [Ipomoea batatas]
MEKLRRGSKGDDSAEREAEVRSAVAGGATCERQRCVVVLYDPVGTVEESSERSWGGRNEEPGTLNATWTPAVADAAMYKVLSDTGSY